MEGSTGVEEPCETEQGVSHPKRAMTAADLWFSQCREFIDQQRGASLRDARAQRSSIERSDERRG